MNFDLFLSLLNGVSVIVTADLVGTPQCVDLAQLWARVLGAPRFTGNAKDIYNQPGDLFDQVPNTPTNSPLKGDIVVWSGDFNGGAGHVAIATGVGNQNSFQAFEQNDPTEADPNDDCQVKTYKYSSVLGWLHPKNDPQNLIDSLRNERDTNYNLYQATLKERDDFKTKYEDEQQNNIKLNSTISDLGKVIDGLKAEDKDYAAQILDAQHQRDDFKATVEATANALQCPTDLKSILSAIDSLRQPHEQVVKEYVSLGKAIEDFFYKRIPKDKTISWGFLGVWLDKLLKLLR